MKDIAIAEFFTSCDGDIKSGDDKLFSPNVIIGIGIVSSTDDKCTTKGMTDKVIRIILREKILIIWHVY